MLGTIGRKTCATQNCPSPVNMQASEPAGARSQLCSGHSVLSPRFVFSVSVAFLVVGMEYLRRKSLGKKVCSTYAGRGHSPPWWQEPRQLIPFSLQTRSKER